MEYGDKEKTISEYMTIKKHIKACFDMKKFIDIMKDCIDKSQSFDFSSTRARKFINPQKPIFILKTSMLDNKDVSSMSNEQLTDELDKITKQVSKEIIDPISDRMMDTLMDPDRYHELVSINKDLVDLCITNMYKIRIDSKRGMVQLEYFDF